MIEMNDLNDEDVINNAEMTRYTDTLVMKEPTTWTPSQPPSDWQTRTYGSRDLYAEDDASRATGHPHVADASNLDIWFSVGVYFFVGYECQCNDQHSPLDQCDPQHGSWRRRSYDLTCSQSVSPQVVTVDFIMPQHVRYWWCDIDDLLKVFTCAEKERVKQKRSESHATVIDFQAYDETIYKHKHFHTSPSRSHSLRHPRQEIKGCEKCS